MDLAKSSLVLLPVIPGSAPASVICFSPFTSDSVIVNLNAFVHSACFRLVGEKRVRRLKIFPAFINGVQEN